MIRQDTVMRRYGLGVASGFSITDTLRGQLRIGKIQPCFAGSTLCATCHVHKDCKLLLTVKPDLGLTHLHVEADLLAWLATGTTIGEIPHFELGNHVKSQFYRMKLRRPK
jgi:hypothetical protein